MPVGGAKLHTGFTSANHTIQDKWGLQHSQALCKCLILDSHYLFKFYVGGAA